jgi:hypothetical protein
MRQVKYRDEQNRLVMMRVGNIADMDRSFDIEFWQSQDDTARFDAAWELVVFAHGLKGQKEDELRLQRSVESIERMTNTCESFFLSRSRPMEWSAKS